MCCAAVVLDLADTCTCVHEGEPFVALGEHAEVGTDVSAGNCTCTRGDLMFRALESPTNKLSCTELEAGSNSRSEVELRSCEPR